jgi:ribonucleoside-triphosphate reductase
LVHELVAKFGTPYFENRIPSYRSGVGDNEVKIGCYQCCAYDQSTTDKEDPQFWDKLYFKDGAHFSWGAWQVVSLNAPQHAYLAKGDDAQLFEELEKSMRMAIRVFEIKERWMKSQMKNGLLPFMTQTPRINGKKLPPAVDSSQLRHVFGLVGVNELVQYHTGYQLHEDDSALRFALRFIVEMERIKEMLQEESGLLLACARTPAESTAQKMAISDLVHFKEQAMHVVKGDLSSIGANGTKNVDLPVYYSNGTHVTVDAEIPLSKKISIENKFFPALSGGNIFHVWLGEAHPDPEALMQVTRRMFTETAIGYMAYTKDMSVCRECNSTSGGLLDQCPICNARNLEWYSRITGYYQAVSGWNAGKKQELKNRYRLRQKMLVS